MMIIHNWCAKYGTYDNFGKPLHILKRNKQCILFYFYYTGNKCQGVLPSCLSNKMHVSRTSPTVHMIYDEAFALSKT